MDLFRDRRHPVLIAAGAEDDEGLRLRVWLLGLFALALFAVLTVQLVRLQVFRHDDFEAQATINRIRNTTLPAERGLIFDRDGRPLVENVPAFAISVVPADVPDGEERRIRIGTLGEFDLELARDGGEALEVPAALAAEYGLLPEEVGTEEEILEAGRDPGSVWEEEGER